MSAMESQYYDAPPHPHPNPLYHQYPHYQEHQVPPPIYNLPPPPGVEPYGYSHVPSSTYYPPEAIRHYGVPPVNVVDSIHNNSIYPVDPSSLNGYPLVDGATANFPNKKEVSQHMLCEVCNVDCNSKDVFDRHILGKQHMKKMALLPHAGALSARFTTGSSVAAGKDLETKKRKLVECGAAVGSVRTCSICNVVCNDQIVYNDHMAGKKHALQAGLMLTNPMIHPKPILNASRVKNANRKGPKRLTIVQSAWCAICGIDCNSQEMLEIHKKGKKHQKNVDKLKIGPQENPKKKAEIEKATSALEEDVETKRQKVVSEGAAADEVRVCSTCKVVCNSQLVFESHLKGQKHANNMKKQAEGSTSAPAVTVS